MSFRKALKLAIDGIVASLSWILAYMIRHDGVIPPERVHQMWVLLGPVVVAYLLALAASGHWNCKWRHFAVSDAARLAASAAVVSVQLALGRLALPEGHLLRVGGGIITVDFLLVLCMSFVARLAWRIACERTRAGSSQTQPRRLLLLGAGFHGVTVAKEMLKVRGVRIVGFLDDDPQKAGSTFAGVPVLGSTSDLPEIVGAQRIDEVLVCIPPAKRTGLMANGISRTPDVRMRIVPTIEEILTSDTGWPSDARGPRSVAARPRFDDNEYRTTTLQNKRILITGGAGFIGSSLARHLSAHNELVLVDLTFSGKPIGFTSLLGRPNVRLVEGNILEDATLAEACQDVDIVIHTAAVLGVERVCEGATATLETNYVGTSRLLQALKRNKPLDRLIYFSTSEVFGVNSYRVDENTPPSVGPIAEARWSYAIAKLAGEHLVKSYHRETGLPVVIVRPFNVFGPRRTGDYALSRFILSALAGRPIMVHGDGTQIRSWCYIEDFCQAVLAMLEVPGAVGEDFNVGNPDNTITVRDLARKVVELTDSESPVMFMEHPFPDVSIRVPSLTKAQRVLGYQPRVDLETGLLRTIQFYRDHWDQFSSSPLVSGRVATPADF